MKDERRLTGVIFSNDLSIPFLLESFKFILLHPNPIYNRKSTAITTIRGDNNGFIHGRLYDGKHISIFLGDKVLTLISESHVYSSIYFIYGENNVDFSNIKGISFEGQLINSIVGGSQPQANGFLSTSFVSDQIESTLNIDISKQTRVSYAEQWEGLSARIEFQFDVGLPFECVLKYYQIVDDICKFLTFRSSSNINTFELTAPNEILDGLYTPVARCHIRSHYNQPDTEIPSNIITFQDIGSQNIHNLFTIFDISNGPKPYLNFLPLNDDDENYIDIIRVKEICAALESELSHISFDATEEETMRTLKNDVKTVIKTHRDGPNPLMNRKTYDRIMGDMKHWNLSLADKIYLQYRNFDETLVNLGTRRQISFIGSLENIAEFVNFRNNNSHGKFTKVSNSIAKTAYAMMGLTYCSLLKRIGLVENEIFVVTRKIL